MKSKLIQIGYTHQGLMSLLLLITDSDKRVNVLQLEVPVQAVVLPLTQEGMRLSPDERVMYRETSLVVVGCEYSTPSTSEYFWMLEDCPDGVHAFSAEVAAKLLFDASFCPHGIGERISEPLSPNSDRYWDEVEKIESMNKTQSKSCPCPDGGVLTDCPKAHNPHGPFWNVGKSNLSTGKDTLSEIIEVLSPIGKMFNTMTDELVKEMSVEDVALVDRAARMATTKLKAALPGLLAAMRAPESNKSANEPKI